MTTSTTDQNALNAVAIKEAFDAANLGDAGPLVGMFADDFTVSAWTLQGGNQRLLTKDQYLEAMGVVAKLDECRSDVVDATPVGEDIVVTQVRCIRKLGEIEGDAMIVMAWRFTPDGKLLRGAEICSQKFEDFWAATGIDD